jgi:ADP-heptose:LPS heptosyltransferase
MPTFNLGKIQKLKKINKFLSFFYSNKKKIFNEKIDREETKSILIIGFLLIGDTIIFLPALRILRKNFPNTCITLIGGKAVKTILESQHIIDNFIIVDCPWIAPFNKSLKNILDFFNGIRKANSFATYDLAIEFRGDWRNIFYMNFIKSKRKVSYNYTGGEYMLTDIIIPNPSIEHFGEEALYFLKQLGCEFSLDEYVPKLVKDKDTQLVEANFIEEFNLEDKKIIGLHPGTSQAIKQWDKEKYSELILRIASENKEVVFLIFEGPGERETVASIEKILQINAVKFIVIKRNLKEYIDIIGLCNLMICNDSGAAHIAAAYGIVAVVIFANVDPKYVTPISSAEISIISHSLECKPCFSSVCKYGTNACIKAVTVEEVFAATQKILATNL